MIAALTVAVLPFLSSGPPAEAPAPAPVRIALPGPFLQTDTSSWGPRPESWEITLGGSGSNNQDFDAGGFALAGSLGYFYTENHEVGVRQNVNYSDFGPSVWNGSTRLFYDYNFGTGTFRPFLGANIGWVYGDAVEETMAAAPEAGAKLFLTETAFLFLLAEYQFFFENADDADDAFDDGSFVYSVGVGLIK